MNPSESDQPYPPRFRWLKRLGLIGVIALALLVGLRLWWGHLAQKRLDALVNDIHARGGKILISDYRTAPIADDQNAAVTLRAAFTSMVTSKEESDWLF